MNHPLHALLSMGSVGVEHWSTDSHSFSTKSESFDDISSASNTTVNHDFDFFKQMGSECADLVEDIDGSG